MMTRCTAAVLALVAPAFAGPLDPPTGPIAPTAKPLAEVEPRIAINATNTPGDADALFKITQPGSYYLTGNITGVAGKHGIEIFSSGVTLDLNGFDLVGVPGMGNFDGVSITAFGLTNIAVRNGSVRNWGSEGIDVAAALNISLADVRASGNFGVGIASGSATTISGCNSYNNSGGIYVGLASTITGCTAFNNTGDGFQLFAGSTISGSTAYTNTANGINASNGCTISGCNAYANAGNGISASGDSRIVGNTCDSNGNGGDGAGILVTGSDNRIEGNNCTDSDRGLDVNVGGNIIVRNTCAGNVTNWDIASGNALAPIVIATTNAAAVFGSSYAGSLNSTDPNANFTY